MLVMVNTVDDIVTYTWDKVTSFEPLMLIKRDWTDIIEIIKIDYIGKFAFEFLDLFLIVEEIGFIVGWVEENRQVDLILPAEVFDLSDLFNTLVNSKFT